MSTISDRALEHLADDEITLIDFAAELERDRDAYRLLAQVALEHCHTLTATCRRQKDTIARLHAIIRSYIGVADEQRAA